MESHGTKSEALHSMACASDFWGIGSTRSEHPAGPVSRVGKLHGVVIVMTNGYA
jgi:hypothetical protein